MKKLKKVLFKFVDVLPREIRGRIVRSQLNYKYPTDVYGDVTYKIADTEEELHQAYKLVQEAYSESNLVDDKCSSMRITKYNLLPTTTVIVAKYNEEVVGTISQIMDTRMGLPIDGVADISKFRDTGKRISEISSFAVKKEWRTGRRSLLLPLGSLMLHYLYKQVGSSYATCVINKKAKHLYEDIFNFQSLVTKDIEYQFVSCEPPVALCVDLEDLYKKSKIQYRNKKSALRNFYLMLTNPVWKEQVLFNGHKFHLPIESVLKPAVIKRFFANNDILLSELSKMEKVVLHNLYFIPEYKQSLKLVDIESSESRDRARFFTNMDVFFLDEVITKAQCLEFSEKALCIQTDNSYDIGAEVKVCINLNESICCYLNIKIMWKYKNRYGLYIQNDAYMWHEYIDEITKKYFHLTDQEEQLQTV